MTRISDRLLVQGLDGDGIVIVDDTTGAEIVVPAAHLDRLIVAIGYFRDAFTERLLPREDGPELPDDGTKLGRRTGKGRWSR